MLVLAGLVEAATLWQWPGCAVGGEDLALPHSGTSTCQAAGGGVVTATLWGASLAGLGSEGGGG